MPLKSGVCDPHGRTDWRSRLRPQKAIRKMVAKLWDPTFSDRKVSLNDKLRLPLLLASKYVASDRQLEPLSAFRMQKGIFLLQQEGPFSWTVFPFRPFDWGPYSSELEGTLRLLLERKLMEKDPKSNYSGYVNTEDGEKFVAPFLAELDEQERDLVRGVRIVAARAFLRV
jgi:hypothetical protein